MSQCGSVAGMGVWPVPVAFVEWCGGDHVVLEPAVVQAYVAYCGAFPGAGSTNRGVARGRIGGVFGRGGHAGFVRVGRAGDGVGGANERSGGSGGVAVDGRRVAQVGGGARAEGSVRGDGGRSVDGDAAGGDTLGGRDDQRGRCTNGTMGDGKLSQVGAPGVRGPNYERNQRNRERRAARLHQLVSPVVGSATGVRGGVFEGCTKEVQDELRETRAKLLVLENKRRALEEERKIARLESPVSALREVLEILTLAERGSKVSGSKGVAAWAEAVASSAVGGVVRGAGSNLSDSAISGADRVSVLSGVRRVKPGLSLRSSVRSSQRELSQFHVEVLPRTNAENLALRLRIITNDSLLTAREKYGRALNSNDFLNDTKVVFRLDGLDREQMIFCRDN